MKRKLIRALILLVSPVIMLSCSGSNGDTPTSITFTAQAVNGLSKSIDMGGTLIVDEYKVKFYKIEIGNSEVDKFTLWESSEGVELNLSAGEPVEFENLQGITDGTYKFCRVTVDQTINLSGSYSGIDGTASIDVTGNFSSDGAVQQFLFGTAETSASGNFLLTEEIIVEDGVTLSLVIDVSGTVTYSSGIQLTAPSMTFSFAE